MIACVDGRNGMAFHNRRQSQDRLARWDILKEAGRAPLWVNAVTARQFTDGQQSRLRIDEAFLDRAGSGEFCFVEDRSVKPYETRIEQVILYRWNRAYPADVHLAWDPAAAGFSLAERTEFPGHSHKAITRERYVRGADHDKT